MKSHSQELNSSSSGIQIRDLMNQNWECYLFGHHSNPGPHEPKLRVLFIQPARHFLHLRSLISLCSPHEETLHPCRSKMHPVKILIRLHECPGWSESSLGAHVWRNGSCSCGSFLYISQDKWGIQINIFHSTLTPPAPAKYKWSYPQNWAHLQNSKIYNKRTSLQWSAFKGTDGLH